MDERALVRLARNGRADAIDELFTRPWPVVWQWAFAVVGGRQLADQVAQESILRGFAALQRFDTDHPASAVAEEDHGQLCDRRDPRRASGAARSEPMRAKPHPLIVTRSAATGRTRAARTRPA
jgi:hypothetical protein